MAAADVPEVRRAIQDRNAWERDRIHTMLGKEFRTGDGRVWRVNTISGATRADTANLRHVRSPSGWEMTTDADGKKAVRPLMRAVPDEDTSELMKLNVGLVLDAWIMGLIEEV